MILSIQFPWRPRLKNPKSGPPHGLQPIWSHVCQPASASTEDPLWHGIYFISWSQSFVAGFGFSGAPTTAELEIWERLIGIPGAKLTELCVFNKCIQYCIQWMYSLNKYSHCGFHYRLWAWQCAYSIDFDNRIRKLPGLEQEKPCNTIKDRRARMLDRQIWRLCVSWAAITAHPSTLSISWVKMFHSSSNDEHLLCTGIRV